MINHIRGKILFKERPYIVIELNSGISYELEVSDNTYLLLPELQQEAKLHTHLVIRDDTHLLIGFKTIYERIVFRKLIKISSVGVKLALAILSRFNPEELVIIILNKDSKSLFSISGVGKKTAERLCIELQDIAKNWSKNTQSTIKINNNFMDAKQALIVLGFNDKIIDDTLSKLDKIMPAKELIKQALILMKSK